MPASLMMLIASLAESLKPDLGLTESSLVRFMSLTIVTAGVLIPLGSIITDGNSASIKNESSATTIDELKEVPVKLELSSSAWTALETLNTTIQEYEESTPEETVAEESTHEESMSSLNIRMFLFTN